VSDVDPLNDDFNGAVQEGELLPDRKAQGRASTAAGYLKHGCRRQISRWFRKRSSRFTP
jgi:hypothetical protein